MHQFPFVLITLILIILPFCQCQPLVIGNVIVLPPNDPDLVAAIAAVKPAIAKRFPKFSIDSIIKAESQVVAGKKYFVTLQLIQVKSDGKRPNKTDSSKKQPNGSKRICTAEIVIVPWRRVTELIALSCNKSN